MVIHRGRYGLFMWLMWSVIDMVQTQLNMLKVCLLP